MMHQSIATIDKPQFLNLQPLQINPLMSKCEIKVLYTGENRNMSLITKQVASEMAKTLRGAPIVGYFRPEKEDFGDHGEQIIIQDGEIKFKSKTKPYGFVPTDAEVWFQNFTQTDAKGATVVREYLMTTGYLWTGQYEECANVVKNGNPQSMELDSESLQGHWSNGINDNLEFFIINDAIFSKLCILGNDVEPCFEGASVTAPKHYTMDANFTKTLYSMIQDMKSLLEGGVKMEQMKNQDEVVKTSEEEIIEQPAPTEFKKEEEEKEDKPAEGEDKEKSSDKDEKELKDEEKSDEEPAEDDEEEKKKKYELLESENERLQNETNTLNTAIENLRSEYASLESKYQELVEFKNQIENTKKDELIDSFYMLSDEDKKEVLENKSNYSYDDIEAKLCVLCVRKGLSFKKQEPAQEKPAIIFQLNEVEDEDVPPFIRALRSNKQ